ALGDQLKVQDPKATMPGHFLALRHQDGDDWDYCVIEHEGMKATVEAGTPPPPNQTPVSAWHEDTYVVGPAWTEFARAMGVGAANTTANVFEVATWRPAPGHRAQLQQALSILDPASTVQIGRI